MKELERVAMNFRESVRAKAGLAADWDRASEAMRNFYRHLAIKAIELKEKVSAGPDR